MLQFIFVYNEEVKFAYSDYDLRYIIFNKDFVKEITIIKTDR